MSEPDLKLFAAHVNDQRLKNDWSQERLGQEAGIATNTVFSIEHAKPTLSKSRRRVAKALGIEMDDE
jgi:ribosome-binding protein aMBF1 (putative translation factor)